MGKIYNIEINDNISNSNYKGIDISEWQRIIDFKKIKDKVDFVIIRGGYGKSSVQVDKFFEENYKGCKDNNIPCGLYWYSYATSVDEAKKEAETMLKIIKGRQFEYPIYFDVEDKHIRNNCSRQLITDIVNTFCSIVESNGYYVGIYANTDWFNNVLYTSQLKRFDKWLAHWSYTPLFDSSFGGMWQFSSDGIIDGVADFVDCNISYKNYPYIIKNKKLNGYGQLELKIGNRVKVKQDAKDYDKNSLASFVYEKIYSVMEIKNDRIVIGIDNVVTAAINKQDLIIL